MTMTSEKPSTRRLELEQVKSLCKEEDHHPNMEVAIGSLQRKKELQVLSKKRKVHGTQLSQEEFLMSMSRQLLKLSPLNILLNLRELLPTDSWMTTTSEKPSTKRLGLELVKSPCKEEDPLPNTGKHHQQF